MERDVRSNLEILEMSLGALCDDFWIEGLLCEGDLPGCCARFGECSDEQNVGDRTTPCSLAFFCDRIVELSVVERNENVENEQCQERMCT